MPARTSPGTSMAQASHEQGSASASPRRLRQARRQIRGDPLQSTTSRIRSSVIAASAPDAASTGTLCGDLVRPAIASDQVATPHPLDAPAAKSIGTRLRPSNMTSPEAPLRCAQPRPRSQVERWHSLVAHARGLLDTIDKSERRQQEAEEPDLANPLHAAGMFRIPRIAHPAQANMVGDQLVESPLTQVAARINATLGAQVRRHATAYGNFPSYGMEPLYRRFGWHSAA